MIYGIDDLLRVMLERGASDLHIKAGSPPGTRVHGELLPLEDMAPLTPDDTERIINSMMEDHHRRKFAEKKELDFAYSFSDLYRFRVNVMYQRKSMAAVLRSIPMNVKSIEELGLPGVLKDLAMKRRGLVLVTGPTGSGKSTTLASMIDFINSNRKCHIVTMEDPIEFIHSDNMCFINQREVGEDTNGFDEALSHVLRQDPDVILVGEMRDHKTIETAIVAAETGHLVMSTLHTKSAAETVDRIIDVFPPSQQSQIRTQLSVTLEAVICQELVPKLDGRGRVAALEIMLSVPAVGNLIRESKTPQLINVIQTHNNIGMITRDQCLKQLYEKRIISFENAILYANNPEELKRMLGKSIDNIREYAR